MVTAVLVVLIAGWRKRLGRVLRVLFLATVLAILVDKLASQVAQFDKFVLWLQRFYRGARVP